LSMGITYSRLVFMPPNPPSYSDALDGLQLLTLDYSSIRLPDNSFKFSRDLDEEEEKKDTQTTEVKNAPQIPILHFKWQGNEEKDPFTIIYSHGNAEDIGQSAELMKLLKNKLQVEDSYVPTQTG